MKPLTLLVSLLFSVALLFGQETGVIEGDLLDRDTKQEIIGAKIEVLNTMLGTVSDNFQWKSRQKTIADSGEA